MPLDLSGNKLYKTSIGPTGESIKSIITDNLLVHLDAQNLNSYGGSGNIWTDLNGNYNSTMYNSPTYNSSAPSNLQLNGSNQYIELGSFFTFNYFTISLWVSAGGSQTTYADIFDNNHTGARNLVCQQNADSLNQYGFSVIGSSNSSDTGLFSLSTNTWTHLSFTFDGSVARGYKNGSLFEPDIALSYKDDDASTLSNLKSTDVLNEVGSPIPKREPVNADADTLFTNILPHLFVSLPKL